MNHRRGRIARPMRGVSALCGITLVVSLVLGTVALAPHVNAAPPSVNAAPEPASPTTGSSAPAVTANPVTPASLEFGPQQPFTSSPPQQLTFTNTTGSAINVQRTVEGGEGGLFTLSGCPFEPALLPGQSCVLTVVFQPKFRGTADGNGHYCLLFGQFDLGASSRDGSLVADCLYPTHVVGLGVGARWSNQQHCDGRSPQFLDGRNLGDQYPHDPRVRLHRHGEHLRCASLGSHLHRGR